MSEVVSFKKRKIKRDTLRKKEGDDDDDIIASGTKTGKDLELDNAGDDDAEVSIPDDAENNSKEAGYATEEKADVNVMQLKEKLNKRLKANSGQGIVASTKQNREALSARELESQASYESSRSAAPDISKTRVVAMEVQQTVVSAKDAAKPKWERTGPMRQSSHVRAISRFDFQADVCKDYKETGWCGYGDSCKFMHDRGDYKTGAQLEREYEENQKRLKMSGGDDDDEEDYTIKEEDDLPFACFICKEDFTDPVVTRCNHFFCEKCALKRFAKDSKCFCCGQQTGGTFNVASKLISAIERRKQAEGEADEAVVPKRSSNAAGWAIPKGQYSI